MDAGRHLLTACACSSAIGVQSIGPVTKSNYTSSTYLTPLCLPRKTQFSTMDSKSSPTRLFWDDEDEFQWRQLSHHYSPSPAVFSHPFTGVSSPPHYNSVERSAHMGLLQPSYFVQPSHGLPALSPSPITAPTEYKIPGQRHSVLSLQTATTSPSSTTQLPRAVRARQLQRRWELEDRAYPLKLIRELDKLQGQLPRVSKEKPIFGVMHVNNSAEHGLIVDNVSIYTTVQDANDRVLDFWDREYGTGMFTNISRHAEDSTMPLKFEYIDNMADHHPYHGVPSQNKSEDYPSGGILTNNSQWKIDNMCLSLKQKSNEVEKKVYVLISYVENHGIHI